MTDINIVVDAVRQLNQVWSVCCKDIEKEDNASEVYNAICEIDEAIINLVDKVSLCAKTQLVYSMYGDSPLTTTHYSVVKRNCV